MSPTDSVFLLGESREHPMHVGGLQLFALPEDAGPDYVSDFHRELLELADVRPLFRRRPRGGRGCLGFAKALHGYPWRRRDVVVIARHEVRLFVILAGATNHLPASLSLAFSDSG